MLLQLPYNVQECVCLKLPLADVLSLRLVSSQICASIHDFNLVFPVCLRDRNLKFEMMDFMLTNTNWGFSSLVLELENPSKPTLEKILGYRKLFVNTLRLIDMKEWWHLIESYYLQFIVDLLAAFSNRRLTIGNIKLLSLNSAEQILDHTVVNLALSKLSIQFDKEAEVLKVIKLFPATEYLDLDGEIHGSFLTQIGKYLQPDSLQLYGALDLRNFDHLQGPIFTNVRFLSIGCDCDYRLHNLSAFVNFSFPALETFSLLSVMDFLHLKQFADLPKSCKTLITELYCFKERVFTVDNFTSVDHLSIRGNDVEYINWGDYDPFLCSARTLELKFVYYCFGGAVFAKGLLNQLVPNFILNQPKVEAANIKVRDLVDPNSLCEELRLFKKRFEQLLVGHPLRMIELNDHCLVLKTPIEEVLTKWTDKKASILSSREGIYVGENSVHIESCKICSCI